MNSTYFFKLQRQLLPITMVFAAILTMYTAVIIGMYDPESGKAMLELIKSMPKVFEAVGITSVVDTLVKHLNSYLFGFIYKVFPLVMVLFGTWTVYVKPLTTKTLTTEMSAPLSRGQIVTTQMVSLVLQIIAVMGYVLVLTLVLSEISFAGELELAVYVRLMFGLIGLLLFESALCYAVAIVVPRAQLGIGIALCLGFLIVQMLARAADSVSWMKLCTPLTLFNQTGLIEGSEIAFLQAIILYLLAVLFFSGSAFYFTRKNIAL